MTHNTFYKCKVCETTIRMRLQVGYFDVPIDVYCPICNTHFSGKVEVLQEAPGLIYDISNLTPIKGESFDGYIIELSTEFMQKKARKDEDIRKNKESYILSPFMRSDFKNVEYLMKLIEYSKNTDEVGEKIVSIYNLIHKKENQLLINYIKKEEDPWINFQRLTYNFDTIKNELDVLVASKHYITAMLRLSMTPTYSAYIDNVKKIINNLFDTKKNEIKHYLKYLSKGNCFSDYTAKIPKYLNFVLPYFDHLIPIVSNYEKFNEIDLSDEGITTVSVKKLCNLYTDGYELLSEMIDIVIGVSNILKNTAFDDFGFGKTSYIQKINSYKSKIAKYRELLHPDIDFNEPFIDILDSSIRNSIQHNNWSVDGLNQTVCFKDSYRGKNRDTTIFFAELTYKVVTIYNAVLLLLEFYYQLHKMKLIIVDNLRPNYISSK